MPHPSTTLSRRSLMLAGAAGAGLLAAPALTGCSQATGEAVATEPSSGGGEVTKIGVALGWLKNVEWAGEWIAQDKGWFRDEKLTVDWQAGGPNAPEPVASVAAGAADVGINAGMQALVQAIGQGNDLVIIGAIFQDSPSALLSLASAPVRTVRDMVGQKVLGQQGVQIQLDAAFRIAGIKPDYEFVTASFDPGPLVEKQGIAYTCYLTNQPLILADAYGVKPADYVVTPFSALGLPTYASLIFAKRSSVEKERDALVGFLRASSRGWQANAPSPEPGARLAVEEHGKDLGLTMEQQIQENTVQTPLTTSDLTASKGLLRIDVDTMAGKMYDGFAAAGLTGLPDPSRIVDMSLLDDVYADGTTL